MEPTFHVVTAPRAFEISCSACRKPIGRGSRFVMIETDGGLFLLAHENKVCRCGATELIPRIFSADVDYRGVEDVARNAAFTSELPPIVPLKTLGLHADEIRKVYHPHPIYN